MNAMVIDGVISKPQEYVRDILENEFVDIYDGVNTFKNIQPRAHDDEFAKAALEVAGPGYEVSWNFVRRSPFGQEEPNFIHTDEMMGDLTAILYLNYGAPKDDGTTLYDEKSKPSVVFYSAFNRMVIFESKLPHSRNIFENFGEGNGSRLVQVVFLKEQKNEGH